jgi:predicted HAD superfamily Cof-like phosphohydrolase
VYWDIETFHRKFGIEYDGPPRTLPEDMGQFREGFMREEVMEYVDARRRGDLAGQLDALVDLVYVALGTSYLHGFDFNEAWRRVHAANMRKVRAASIDDSKRASTYDVVKPRNWLPPDLSDLTVVPVRCRDCAHLEGSHEALGCQVVGVFRSACGCLRFRSC